MHSLRALGKQLAEGHQFLPIEHANGFGGVHTKLRGQGAEVEWELEARPGPQLALAPVADPRDDRLEICTRATAKRHHSSSRRVARRRSWAPRAAPDRCRQHIPRATAPWSSRQPLHRAAEHHSRRRAASTHACLGMPGARREPGVPPLPETEQRVTGSGADARAASGKEEEPWSLRQDGSMSR